MDEIRQIEKLTDEFISEFEKRIIEPLQRILQIRHRIKIDPRIDIPEWVQKKGLFRKPELVSGELAIWWITFRGNTEYSFRVGISEILCTEEKVHLTDFSLRELRLIAGVVPDLVQQLLEQLSSELNEFNAVNKVSDFALGKLGSAAETIRNRYPELNEAS